MTLYRDIRPLPSLRMRLEMSIDPAGELLDSASPALGGLRRAVRIAYERLRSRLDQLVHGELGSALQEPHRHAPQRPLRDPGARRRQGQGPGHRPRPVGQRPDAVRRAAHRGRAGQRLARGAAQGPGRGGAHPRRAVRRWWAARRRTCARRSTRSPGSTSGRPRPASPRSWTRSARRPPSGAEVALLSARHPGLSGRVVPIDVRLGGDYTAVVITGPQHRRQDGGAADGRAAGADAPVRAARAGGDRQPRCPSSATSSRTSATSSRWPSRCPPSAATCARSCASSRAPGRAAWCCSTSSAPAPTRPRARRSPRRSSTTSSRRGALVIATTHYAEIKTYAHNTPPARNASVEFDLETLSPTYRLTIGLPGTSQAFAIAERLGLPPTLVADARSRLSRAQQEFESTLASIKASQRRDRGGPGTRHGGGGSAPGGAPDRGGRAPARPPGARDSRSRRRARRRRRRSRPSRRRSPRRASCWPARRSPSAAWTRRWRAWRSDCRRCRRPGHRGASPAPRGVAGRACAPGPPAGWSGTDRRPRPRPRPRDAGRRRRARGRAARRARCRPTRCPSARAGRGRRGTAGRNARSRVAAATSGRSRRCASPRPRPSVGRTAQRSGRGPSPSSLDVRGARVDETIELLENYLDRAATAGAGASRSSTATVRARSGMPCARCSPSIRWCATGVRATRARGATAPPSSPSDRAILRRFPSR